MSADRTAPDPRARLLEATVDLARRGGVGGRSLRQLAEALGTSHRMLIYHFGSHEGLMAAVVGTVEASQRQALAGVVAADGDAWERSRAYWRAVVEAADEVAPLFFELAGQALQRRPPMVELLPGLVGPWLEVLAALYVEAGIEPREARVHARIGLAAARGLLLDLAATGDRDGVDAAADLLAEMTRARVTRT